MTADAGSVAELRRLLEGPAAIAVPILRAGAEAGLPEAQARYGEALLEGRGVPANPRAALGWFIHAAHSGHAAAINMVGRCHERGWGTPVDLAVAARCYRRAAGAGLDWGMYNYAGALGQGAGVVRDERAATVWFGRAAALGHTKSIGIVGALHEEGRLLPRDLDAAERCYRIAAAKGDFRSQFHLARRLAMREKHNEAAGALREAWAGAHDRFRWHMRDTLEGADDPGLRSLAETLPHDGTR